jgi:flagellar basal body rod protein FlgF
MMKLRVLEGSFVNVKGAMAEIIEIIKHFIFMHMM